MTLDYLLAPFLSMMAAGLLRKMAGKSLHLIEVHCEIVHFVETVGFVHVAWVSVVMDVEGLVVWIVEVGELDLVTSQVPVLDSGEKVVLLFVS